MSTLFGTRVIHSRWNVKARREIFSYEAITTREYGVEMMVADLVLNGIAVRDIFDDEVAEWPGVSLKIYTSRGPVILAVYEMYDLGEPDECGDFWPSEYRTVAIARIGKRIISEEAFLRMVLGT